MKAISIHPEPVMDILLGKKKEEYRSWTTHHRGPLLICSTAIKTPGCISGYAVCIVDLTDVKNWLTILMHGFLRMFVVSNRFQLRGNAGFTMCQTSRLLYQWKVNLSLMMVRRL